MGSAPADLVPLDFAATAASVGSGDSLAAGHVSAMGMRMNATPTLALAWAAVITPGVSTVKGEPGAALSGLVGGQAAQDDIVYSCLSMQVHCRLPWRPSAATRGPVPALPLPRRPWEPAALCHFLPSGWVLPADHVPLQGRLHG